VVLLLLMLLLLLLPFAPTHALPYILPTNRAVARIATSRMHPAFPARFTENVSASQHLDLLTVCTTARDPKFVHCPLARKQAFVVEAVAVVDHHVAVPFFRIARRHDLIDVLVQCITTFTVV
jgi:hypothetical protein